MYGLGGWVRNTGEGVELEWSGMRDAVEATVGILKSPGELPAMARVVKLEIEEIPVKENPVYAGEKVFRILESKDGAQDTLVAPDLAPCPECLKEMRDPKNRRYRYPFINCTNCGPRFTLIRGVPYDRKKTSMDSFAMCEACGREYRDIRDRRYHAQPTCCPKCGPAVWLEDGDGKRIERSKMRLDVFHELQSLLMQGKIAAIRGIGAFHLACRMDKPEIVRTLRERKQRPSKPLAIMCRDLEAAERLCFINEKERELLTGGERPIVLLRKKDPSAWKELSRTHTLGVMLPSSPIHELLFDGAGYDALVMTSANSSAVPAVTGLEEAREMLQGVADVFLMHDREIVTRCDDSLLQVCDENPVFLRRSRGYAPTPLWVKQNVTGILALGAEQKASFALGKGNQIFYSQHIGDLKNAETYMHYEEQIRHFTKLFGQEPEILVCDLHPDYLSSRYAAENKAENRQLLQVQHHHAHMASCLADNDLTGTGDYIGIIWDGTGLGTDGSIWGSEFLIGNEEKFRRVEALQSFGLPGGDAVTKETGRVALSLCRLADEKLPFYMEEQNVKLLSLMLEKGINCPESSGMGRLFDGVYTLLTGEKEAGYEGQRPVELEAMAWMAADDIRMKDIRGKDICVKDIQVKDSGERWQKCWEYGGYPVFLINCEPSVGDEQSVGVEKAFDTGVLIRFLLRDLKCGIPKEIISARFHNTMIQWAVEACERIREEYELNRVVMSGGVFLNQYLTYGIRTELLKRGFIVYTHRQVSPGDEGIALGQMAVAAAFTR